MNKLSNERVGELMVGGETIASLLTQLDAM